MAWKKKGLIFCPDGRYSWALHTMLTPTPVLREDGIIRIYAGMRDSDGVSRIGYIDVLANNPLKVVRVSSRPVLDIGRPGMFDDNGMILGDVLRDDDGTWRMYYVGFQLGVKHKFSAFSGLAISTDNGETFVRLQDSPIMDRTENGLFIRAIHSVLKEDGVWKIWYSVGCGWRVINSVPYPEYYIRYTESVDGVTFPDRVGVECVNTAENEYRIGRPRVRKRDDGVYEMRYTFDTLDKKYTAGYAESVDGIKWDRMDDRSAIRCSSSGWDSEMACYPCVLNLGDKKYMFYSGNNMGETGVGLAEWAEDD